MTSDLDRIRERASWLIETAKWYATPGNGAPGELDHALAVELPSYGEEILALLDGAVGLTRPGDVVLSAEQHRDMRELLRAWGLGQTDKMQVLALGLFLREFGRAPEPDALLASGRPGEEQACARCGQSGGHADDCPALLFGPSEYEA